MNPKNIIDNVDPSRRSFVRQLLGGAAFVAPVVATFSMDTLTAEAQPPLCSNLTEKEGYIGPNEFQAFLSGPGTKANGVATFIITTPSNDCCADNAKLSYSLQLTKNASAIDGVILFEGNRIVDLPIGTPASIEAPNLRDLVGLFELFLRLRGGTTSMNLTVQVNSKQHVLSGPILPATNSFIIELPLCTL